MLGVVLGMKFESSLKTQKPLLEKGYDPSLIKAFGMERETRLELAILSLEG